MLKAQNSIKKRKNFFQILIIGKKMVELYKCLKYRDSSLRRAFRERRKKSDIKDIPMILKNKKEK